MAPANVGTANPDIQINAVSCPSAGECTAVGSYVDQSGAAQGLLVNESGGSWQPGIEAQLPNSPGADPQVNLTSVSCPATGDCTAIGDYVDIHGWTEGVILTEAGGVWTQTSEVADPVNVPVFRTPDVSLNAVSCPASGDCLVVGTYQNSKHHTQGLLEIERGGKWAPESQQAIGSDLPPDAAAEIPTLQGQPFLTVELDSVSCVAGGQCVTAGSYTDSSGLQQGMLVTGAETPSHSWTFSGTQASLPGDAATSPDVSLSSISCPSLGECAAVGSYHDATHLQQGLLLSESGGVWQTGAAAQLSPDAAADAQAALSSVSCAAVGDCDAVGYEYDNSAGSQQGLALTDTGGSWGQAVTPAFPADGGTIPFGQLSSVSCSAPSSCAAAGNYQDDSFGVHPLLLSQSVDGSWSSPGTEPALPGVGAGAAANVESVACAPAGGCAAIADYTDAAGDALAAAVNGTSAPPATPTLSLTAPPATSTPGTPIALSASLSGGVGETGTVTFGVFGPRSSPPVSCAYGAAMVGSATITGDGAYAPAGEFTPTVAGNYWWYASYGGDLGDSPAASACGPAMAETIVASPPPQTTTTPTTTTTTPTPTTTTTPTPTPTAPASTPSSPSPAAKPVASLTDLKVRRATVEATVVCHATSRQTCQGSLSLLATESGSAHTTSAERMVVVGSTSYTLRGGIQRRLSVALNRTGKSLLRSRHTLATRLRLTFGKRSAVTRTVTFTRSKR